MSLEYAIGDRKYVLNYSELREDFDRYHRMTDREFVRPKTLVKAMHFVCVVSYLKGANGECLTSDEGLIHQLVHLLDGDTRPMTMPRLREIREQFAALCKLA
jgi:hypothetical protein